MVFAMMTGFFSMASSNSLQAQCGLMSGVQVENGCTRHFTFDSKLVANVLLINSYSFDFGDGYVLSGQLVQFTDAFPPTHYDPNLNINRTTGHYNDVYHVYCNPGTTYTYTITFNYINKKGQSKVFECTDSFTFNPNPDYDCSCSSSSDCDFTMSQETCPSKLIFDADINEKATSYSYEIDDQVVYTSTTTPDWTMPLQNIDLCSGSITVTYKVYGEKDSVICETEKTFDVDPGIYIGYGCTSVTVSSLIASGILPPNVYANSCTLHITGELIVDQDYIFDGATLVFASGAGLTVGDVTTGNSGTLTLTNKATLSADCNLLWRGIRVYPTGELVTENECVIRDALYAIRPMVVQGWALADIPRISMIRSVLENNYIGLLAVDGSFGLQTFIGNRFIGGDIYELSGKACGTVNVIAPTGIPFHPYSYAGIFVDGNPFYTQPKVDGALLNLQGISFLNSFEKLSCGINARSGSHTIQGCNFTDINQYGYNLPNNVNAGVGINFQDNNGGNFFRVLNGDFTHVRQGIVAVAAAGPSSIISVGHTVMSDMGGGIAIQDGSYTDAGGTTLYTGGFAGGYIFDNTIDMNWPTPNTGIWVRDIDPTTSYFDIRDNTITANADGSVGIWFVVSNGKVIGSTIGEFGSSNLPVCQDPNAQGSNTVLLNGSGTGIRLQDCHYVNVDRNKIDLASGGFGILTTSSNDFSNLKLNCNCINNIGNGWTQGYFQSGGTKTHVRTTYLSNTNVGMTFQATCPNADIAQNKIGVTGGSMNTGLRYVNASTGDQINKGNRWRGSFGVGAENNMGSPGSSWTVFNGNNQAPPSVTPPGWFLFNGGIDQTEINCTADAPMPPTEAPSGLTAMEYDFISGQLSFTFTGLDWDMRAGILSKILETPTLLDEPNVQSFYAQAANQEVLQALNLRQESKDLFDISPSLQSDLDDMVLQMENISTQLDSIDSLIVQNPTDNGLLTNYNQLSTGLANLHNTYLDMWADVMTDRQNAATAQLAQWAAFAPTTLPGANLKTGWIDYLKVKAMGQKLTDEALKVLQEIAMTCPEKGGSTVHFASGLFSSQTGQWLPIGQCAGNGQKISLPSTSASSTLTIAPNPGNKELTLSVPTDEEYTVTIVSLTGKTMQSKVAETSTLTINTSNLPEGIYMIHVFSKNGALNQTLRWVKSN